MILMSYRHHLGHARCGSPVGGATGVLYTHRSADGLHAQRSGPAYRMRRMCESSGFAACLPLFLGSFVALPKNARLDPGSHFLA